MLPQLFLNQIKAHAESCYPEECCGVVIGSRTKPDLILRVLPLRNAQNDFHQADPESFPRTAETAYLLDPRELLHLEKHFQTEPDEKISFIYHSHPDGQAVFSEEDQRLAAQGGDPVYPDVVYLVCAVNRGKVSAFTCFGWDSSVRRYIKIDG